MPEHKAPPPPRKANDGGLEEVERALSVLDGRHPESMKSEREMKALLDAKRAEIEVEEVKGFRLRLVHGLLLGLALGAIVAGVWSVIARKDKWKRIEAALAPLTEAYQAHGFTVVGTEPFRLESTEDIGCFVAIAAGTAEVERPIEKLSGDKSAAWCSCGQEKIVVTTPYTDKSAGGVRLLRTDAAELGGPDLLALVEPRVGAYGKRLDECAGEQFDGWMSAKKYPPPTKDDKWLDAPERAALKSAGFHSVGSVPVGREFGVVELEAESCAIAVSSVEGDKVSLRLSGGTRPMGEAPGAIAWCDRAGGTQTVWRHGEGEVAVVASPAKRIGALFGAREVAARASIKLASFWVRPEDLSWDATELLLASAVPQAKPTAPSAAGEVVPLGDARLLAFSVPPDGVVTPSSDYACLPTLEPDTVQTLCAQPAPARWRVSGAAISGAAQGPLPTWLTVFSQTRDTDLVRGMVQLLAVARRLHAEGFEPTTLEGVVEQQGGVEVLGRAGDDAVVAVGLGPRAPWIFPYSDGPEWKLDGEPRVVQLNPGERALLNAPQAPTVPVGERRTVVFRRPIKR